MNYDITSIVIAVTGLIFAVISGLVAPSIKNYLATKLTVEQMVALEAAVTIAVQAAEQIYKNIPKSGTNKKTYVLEWLKAQGYNVNTEEVDAYIEAKVNELFGNEAE